MYKKLVLTYVLLYLSKRYTKSYKNKISNYLRNYYYYKSIYEKKNTKKVKNLDYDELLELHNNLKFYLSINSKL